MSFSNRVSGSRGSPFQFKLGTPTSETVNVFNYVDIIHAFHQERTGFDIASSARNSCLSFSNTWQTSDDC
jgi:hypothetical protein